MKKDRKVSKAIIFCIIICCIFNIKVYANSVNLSDSIKIEEYTEEFKEWLALSDEEKSKIVMPEMFQIKNNNIENNLLELKTTNNIIKLTSTLSSSYQPTFNLKDIIPENIVIRNQERTNSCWAFANIGAIESTLALKNYKEKLPTKVFDFSEMHMNYGSSKYSFLDNQVNNFGFYRNPSSGGNSFIAIGYLTNGMGAVEEQDLPFINTNDKIDISNIQNKKVTTTLLDAKIFLTPETDEERENTKSEMKDFIEKYGGVAASIYGAEIFDDNFYNNETGALFCNNTEKKANHNILVVGWDDNYSKDNFSEKAKPLNNGAWIIKNSWGEIYKEKISEIKKELYNINNEYFNEKNINSAEEITTSLVIDLLKSSYGNDKVSYLEENEEVIVEIGNKGFMYVSYEDVNIYKSLVAFQNLLEGKDYDNIYQHDVLGCSNLGNYTSKDESKLSDLYLANVFKRNENTENKTEQISKISIYAPQQYNNLKVYINPNNDGKTVKDLQEVKLKAGDSIDVECGYHVIEFAEPITLTGDSFVVAVKIENTNGEIKFGAEIKLDNSYWQEAEAHSGESFYTDEASISSTGWSDVQEKINANLCIKAFSNYVDKVEEATLSSIEVKTVPTKVIYTEGEKFDSTGLVVLAKYSDETSKEVNNYKITNGDKLENGQEYVTISYTEGETTKTINQKITVNTINKTIEKVEITSNPAKLTYVQNKENIDLTGGKIKATYSDSSTELIAMTASTVTATGFSNTSLGSKTITVSYKGKTATFEVEIIEEAKEKTLEKIEIVSEPTKLQYIQSKENIDLTGGKIKATYSDSSTELILMNTSEVTVTGFNNTSLGSKTITLSYKGKTVTFTVEIIKGVENVSNPVLSNSSNIKAKIISSESHLYNDGSQKPYSIMKIKIDGIKDINNNTTYTYSYYFSGNKNETNINDNYWVKIDNSNITKNSDGTYSIDLSVNSNNLPNVSEIQDVKNLYIYVKEVASVGSNSSKQVNSVLMENTSETIVYLNDKLVGNSSEVIDNKTDKNDTTKDNTTATGTLPNTGAFAITIAISIIGIISLLIFIKYRNIDK